MRRCLELADLQSRTHHFYRQPQLGVCHSLGGSVQLVRLFDLRLKAALTYYIVCLPRALERWQVRAVRNWIRAEARSTDGSPRSA